MGQTKNRKPDPKADPDLYAVQLRYPNIREEMEAVRVMIQEEKGVSVTLGAALGLIVHTEYLRRKGAKG